MCEFVVNSFPFEIIMMGTAARRAGEPFVQQFLDKHSRAVLAPPYPLRLIPPPRHANAVPLFPGGRRLCWRLPPRYALSLRLATPTPSGFSRAGVAFVCAALPATPYSSVGSRQHGPTFPGGRRLCLRRPPPLRLISSPRHANTTRNFPGGLRLCWRPPTRCALFLRLATPTPSAFFRADAAFVGVPLPAAPYSSASPRQHDRKYPDMLAYLGARK